MNNLTWGQMIKLEPRLQSLYERACKYRHMSEHKKELLWYTGGLKAELMELAGFNAINEKLATNQVYETAYQKIAVEGMAL